MRVKPEGERVRALRVASEPNASEFAHKAGISPMTLRAAERGAPLRLNTARKFGAALDVHPRAFCGVISNLPA